MRATALRKLRGSTDDLSEYGLQVLGQQITADLDRIDGNGTANASSYTTGTTANGCHDGHGPAAPAGTSTTRSAAGIDERNLVGTQDDGIKVESEPIRVAGPEDRPQGATLRRPTSVMEDLRVPVESLPHRTGQEVRRAPGKNRRPHQGSPQRRPGPRRRGTERAVVLRSGPRDATGECGGVDREERAPRGRSRTLETASGRVRLDRARKRSRHVVQVGDLRFPQGSDIVVGINKIEETWPGTRRWQEKLCPTPSREASS